MKPRSEKRAWPLLLPLLLQLLLLAALLLPQTEAHAAPPAYRASGTFTAGTGAITVPYPASMLANDVCLLAVESENQPIALTTANGFVQVPTWSPQFAGTAGVDPASRLALFWKRTAGGDAAPVVADAGDHTTGRIHCFSGVITSGDPWDAGAGGNDGGANDTTGTIPGATTTTPDTMVVLLTSNSRNGTSTANCSAWTNASLTSLTERSDNTNTAGLGGGHCMATGLKAAAGAYAATTVTLATTSYKGAISLALKPQPTTTLATGSDPAAATIAPGAAATDVDQFTLQTSSGTEAITSVTVNLSTNSGVGRLAITDNAGLELGFTTSPVAGANTIAVSGMSAITALTTFKVRVTPLSHALMPAVPGAAYVITAPVTAWAGPNTHAGSDTNLNALTIDNLSPSGATATSGSAGTGSVTLAWTTSGSADFNTTGGSVLYRWTTTAGAEVPVEGSAPTVNSVNGAATVACVLSSAASFALSGIIDGTGGSAGCNTTALNPGTAYIYKVFQKDSRGNFDAGVTIGTFTTTYPVPTTASISPTSKTLGALGFTLTVNGTNFTPGSIVRFNGLDRVTTYVSPTQLTATIPATDLTVVGSFPITVFNPTPGGGTSNAQTFTVNPAAPSAVTNAASGVTSAVATLNGTVGTNGGDITSIVFEWGLTTAYGETITATPYTLLAGSTPPYATAAVSALVEGVNCNTVFHYRVVATNSAGTTNGLDGTFTTGSCSAPFPATACAATRYGTDLGCTANDVNITGITLAPGSQSSCVSGAPVSLNLDLTVNFAVPDRWDVGIFIANDGKLPTLLPANGGAGSCSVAVLPIVPETGSYTFPDLDGVPQGTLDTCGDGNGAIDDSALPGGTVPLGDGVKRMTGVTLPCYASAASGGKLFVPFAVSWDNQKSPVGSLCTSNLYPVPNTSSKCNAPASSVSINVVVLPVITKTNGGTQINPGANTTYTVAINNNSGGTLLDMVFTDPAVTNLTVNSVGCAAASGATCPTTSVAAMQGAGISIPSVNLPNNSSLTFTINATLANNPLLAGTHLVNTATVTLTGGGSTSASDDDLIVLAPSAAKSFAPGTIAEDAAALLTITLTNPTASAVTSVAFTDTYPADLFNTSSAGGATTCGGTVTAANGGNSVALSGGTIPASGSCTVTVNVTSATAGSYSNSTGTVTHATGTIPSASATLTVNVATVGAFNAGEVGTWDSNFPLLTPTPHIYTKLADTGTGFNLQLAALKSDGTRLTSYSKAVVVELLDSSVDGVIDPATNCGSGWIPLAPPVSFSADFAPSNPNKGVITVGFPAVPNAYKNVRVRITEGTKIGCSTDYFAIRPSAAILMTTASAAAPSASASATPIFGAGTPFTLYATTTTGTNYNGTLTLDTGKLTAQTTSQDTSQQSGGEVGTLTTGASAPVTGYPTLTANPGSLPSGNATYSEVGYLYLAAGAFRNDSFTLVDQANNDCITVAVDPANYLSDILVGGKYGCSIGNKTAMSLGRFIPHHFDTDVTAACGSFTYSGQPFPLTVTARNQGGVTVKNYEGAFAKDVTLADANGALGTFSPVSVTADKFVLGVADLTSPASVSFAFTIKPSAPATLKVRGTDTDAATSSGGTEDTTPLRFGRLRLINAYGSELLPLRIEGRAEHWDGNRWTLNADDACTSIAAGNVTAAGGIAANTCFLTNPPPANPINANCLAQSPATTFVSGSAKWVIFDRTPRQIGFTDLTLSVPSWLMGDWSSAGTGYDENPVARIKFGSPKAPYIYLRERY